jgi:hypothetical protein
VGVLGSTCVDVFVLEASCAPLPPPPYVSQRLANQEGTQQQEDLEKKEEKVMESLLL